MGYNFKRVTNVRGVTQLTEALHLARWSSVTLRSFAAQPANLLPPTDLAES